MATRPSSTVVTDRRAAANVLQAVGVTVDRGGVRLLQDVHLQLRSGDVALCTGPNGAGKTTLLRVAAGLLRPTGGRVELPDGRIDLIGHTPALHPDLTLSENLQVVARHVGGAPDEVAAALHHVGLRGAADRRAGRCSAGMRRRAEFARLLLTRPRLLLLDEPDVALDGGARPLVDDAIGATLGRGGAAVVATHAPRRLEDLATVRWMVRDGTVTA